MNKKLLFALVLLLPVIIIFVWIYTVTGNKFTPSNVSTVYFTKPDGTKSSFTSNDDKALYIELKDNITAIDDQEFDDSVYSLYTVEFERVQGNEIYYLCLSADVKNCIAYDEKGEWYRINSEYAKKFLSSLNITEVYKYCDIPIMTFSSESKSVELTASQAEWHYILFDGTYADVIAEPSEPQKTDLCVVRGDGFEMDFDLSPDWQNLKIYDGDTMIYDGLLDTVAEIPFEKESELRAVVTAEWYEETNSLYKGRVTYDFYFDFDIRAEYSLSSDNVGTGEALYINLLNTDNEVLDIKTDIKGVTSLTAYPYLDGKIITVPVPADTEPGEYHVNIKSDKTALSIPFTVADKNYSSVNVGFTSGENAALYDSATTLFFNEISSAYKTNYSGNDWIYGFTTPAQKYVEGVEQYWISSPSYGVKQTVGGENVENRSLGIHYVKSATSESLPVKSAAKGIVAFAGATTLYGNTVVISHGLGIYTVYGHIEDISSLTVGATVEAGQLIGNAKPSAYAISSVEFFFGVSCEGVFLNPYNYIVEPRSPEATDKSEAQAFFIGLNR